MSRRCDSWTCAALRRPYRRHIVALMRVREGELQSVATAVVEALQKQGFVHFKREPAVARQRIVEIIARTLEQEQALEEEAERLAESHARKMAGMDQRKIIQGIKERLARERNFPL
jgi:hypothetical protein